MNQNLLPVILSYNHPELTSRCISSVLKQFTNCLLIHNGSLIQHQQKLQNDFPHIDHFIIEQNKGFTGGVNTALKVGFEKHDWILFITNDCELEYFNSDFIKKILEPTIIAPLIYARKKTKIDSFGGAFNLKKSQLQHLKISEENNSIFYLYPLSKWNNISSHDKKNDLPFIKPYIPGTAFFIHKNFYYEVGEFDESLHTYWEDVDFSLRALSLGKELYATNQIQLIHKIGKTCHKHRFYTHYLFRKNQKTITRRWAPLKYKAHFEFEFIRIYLKNKWKSLFFN